MKNCFLLLLLLLCVGIKAQIKGTVTTSGGEAVAFANITIKGTYTSTASNEDGTYSLPADKAGEYILVVRSLGYTTEMVTFTATSFPYTFNIVLRPTSYSRSQKAVAKNSESDNIIEKAIKNRAENAAKTAMYEADFYSRGSYTIKNVPRKLLGKRLSDLQGRLDSTGSGIIYLSETVSRIKYQRPDKLHERVLASKISGDDKGYSYNSASAAEFDFYQKFLSFDVSAVSPLSEDASEYYRFETESTFYDNQQKVSKVKVTPIESNTAAFSGYIYLLEDTGELYATELEIEGSRIGQPLLESLTVKQLFGYNSTEDAWTKNVQSLHFTFSVLGVKAEGNFLYVYSNYNLNPGFTDKTFGNEIMFVEKDANKKTGDYWGKKRPIPLTEEELADYIEKDSIENIITSGPYLRASDSIRNRYKLLSPALGHTYYNSIDSWQIKYSGVLLSLGFNTVQAYALSPSFYYTFTNNDNDTYTTVGTDLNYGFAEDRFRATGTISHKFNNFSKRMLTLNGGSSIQQFNPERPINRIVNSISTLFFKDNYMKLYDNTFVNLSYEEEVVNGIMLYGSFEYTRRKPLFNNTNFSTLKDLYDPYTSNNPLLPYDYETPAFLKHDMMRASVAAQFSFGQKYRIRPSGKENVPNPLYPVVYVKFEKGFGASISDYNFNHLSAKVNYILNIGQFGETGAAVRAGKFFDSDNIAFTDYRHFNGNRTHVGRSERYLNVFNFLPYYTHSTNDSYTEGHIEHNFKGFITNKIPLINKLNYHLVGGYHILSVPGRSPYMEYTVGLDNLGWGKVRFLRIDYIRAYENGFIGDGVVIGLSFLDILE
jgi:hypothetical protein